MLWVLVGSTKEHLIFCRFTMVAFPVVLDLENLPTFEPIDILKAVTSTASKLSCEGTFTKNME